VKAKVTAQELEQETEMQTATWKARAKSKTKRNLYIFDFTKSWKKTNKL